MLEARVMASLGFRCRGDTLAEGSGHNDDVDLCKPDTTTVSNRRTEIALPGIFRSTIISAGTI